MMFSGIIEEMGVVKKVQKKENLFVLQLKSKKVGKGAKLGDSIAVDGVCLTVTKIGKDILEFDLMKETLDKTTFKDLCQGSRVNLERALKANGRLNGHFVTGHIDALTVVTKIVKLPNYVEVQMEMIPSLRKFIAPKGSISLNGVSLTIGNVTKIYFSVYLIPFTLTETNFGIMKKGSKVNIEVDILARYILNNR